MKAHDLKKQQSLNPPQRSLSCVLYKHDECRLWFKHSLQQASMHLAIINLDSM